MHRHVRTPRLHRALLASVCLTGIVALMAADGRVTRAGHQPAGVQNAGIEAGLLGGSPVSWTVAQAADKVVVVDEEGPADFGTYADTNTTVTPNAGDLALRLGQPKRRAESQNRGSNTVTQSFHSDESSYTFALRLLSWEARGDDKLKFDVKDPAHPYSTFPVAQSTGGALTIALPDGSSVGCATTPCEMRVDVGSQGNYLDSGWKIVQVSGLPSDGRLMTLSYSVVTTQNDAHATWAYFDDTEVEESPVAKFGFAPTSPLEGDFVQFVDASTPAGPDIEAWDWTFTGPGIGTVHSNLQHPVFAFPDEDTYSVTLEVIDADGNTNSATSGGEASDGTPIPPVIVGNAGTKLNALNVEVVEGESGPLLGRFLDPGYLDTHSAAWSVGGQNVPDTLTEENDPALASGIVTGDATGGSAGQTLAGTLTVQDNDGGSSSDAFDVVVVGDDFDRREPNNSPAEAPVLDAGWSYLSDLSEPTDLDLFEVRNPDGSMLEPGSQVLVTLGGLTADYDVVLLSDRPGVESAPYLSSPFLSSPFLSSPFLSSPFLSSPFLSSPFLSSPFLSSPYLSSPYLSSPYLSSPYLSSPYLSSPYLSSASTFATYPLSELGFAKPSGTELAGTDIGLGELGLSTLVDADLQVIGYSVNRGTEDDSALFTTDTPGARIYVAVLSGYGSYSSAPYRLSIETSEPLDINAFLGENCAGTPLVAPGDATSAVTVLYDHPGTDLSLFITQRERMMALYQLDAADWDAMMGDLVALANHDAVAADIISIASADYDAWDSSPCSVDAANATAAAIRDEVLDRMQSDSNKQFVVLIGNDDIVPHRRVRDEAVVGNERLYGIDSFILPGTPLFASIQGGNNLTDDYFVSASPEPWQGRELYIPDWSIGRLVETPDEIRGAAVAFTGSDGRLALDTALVTGYDFFNDGAALTAANLSPPLAGESLISEIWDADDLRCELLGDPASGSCGVHDVNAPNAHFAHYAALSADGFTQQTFDDFVSSEEVAAAGGGSALQWTITFTIGCHAGLSVPDRASVPKDAGLTIDPALDFAQAMAQQRAVFIGNTGFGIGEDTGIAGNEALMAIYADELAQGGSAGRALLEAKHRHLLSLAAMDVYEEKSLIQTTFYGLPQYALDVPPGATAVAAAIPPPADVTLTLEDGATTSTVTAALGQNPSADGLYLDADGDTQNTAGRAIQPRIVEPLAADALNGPVHGIVFGAATFTDVLPFDPVVATPSQEWAQLGESALCLDAYSPSTLATLNSLDTLGTTLQTLVVIPAQFRCTSGDAAVVTGTERVYDAMTIALQRSLSSDFEAPALVTGGLQMVELANGDFEVTVDATDPSGIAEIVVLAIGPGGFTPFGSGPLGGPGPFTVVVPGAGVERLVVQIVDGAGNVTTLTGKGVNLRVLRVDAGVDKLVPVPSTATFDGTVEGFDALVAETPDVTFVWDFGDGSFDGGPLAANGVPAPGVTVDGLGDAHFSVDHLYASSAGVPEARLTVLDGAGAIGTDTADITFDDGDGIVPDDDNCPFDFNPSQENANGEPMLLPKPVPLYNDATNPAGDTDGNVCDNDADGDSVFALDEVAMGLDPIDWDTDGDRTNDGTEIACGSDPLDSLDNLTGVDTDSDGLPDACEAMYGTIPTDLDTDDDGVLDGVEVRYWLTDPTGLDSDGNQCDDPQEIGSINSDTLVNIIDLQQMAVFFGPLSPAMRPMDTNGDGVMNVIDLQFSARFRDSCRVIVPA